MWHESDTFCPTTYHEKILRLASRFDSRLRWFRSAEGGSTAQGAGPGRGTAVLQGHSCALENPQFCRQIHKNTTRIQQDKFCILRKYCLFGDVDRWYEKALWWQPTVQPSFCVLVVARFTVFSTFLSLAACQGSRAGNQYRIFVTWQWRGFD